MPRSTVGEFRERVAEAVWGTPCEVTETDKGFNLGFDFSSERSRVVLLNTV